MFSEVGLAGLPSVVLTRRPLGFLCRRLCLSFAFAGCSHQHPALAWGRVLRPTYLGSLRDAALADIVQAFTRASIRLTTLLQRGLD